MSVYKRPGAQTYSYDFRLQGRRFSGDTGKTAKREAEAEERLRRDEARALIAEQAALDAPDTWELASSRYWLEVGQHHKNRETTLTALDWLSAQIGPKTRLRDIDDNMVARLVARRRVETRQVGSAKSRAAGRPVAPATVNRTMTEPLRKVLHRARSVWKVPVADIGWSTHLLAEPQERVREASPGEEAAILDQLQPGYADAVRFAFLSGCRRMEIIGLEWSRVDFFGRQFTVLGKGGRSRTIPMSQAIFDLLWQQRNRHAVAVFAFKATRTRKHTGQQRNTYYPITEHGLRTAARRAVAGSGVVNFRFHDIRHTAATRVLRASNLRVTQILLGHQDIATTTKYAHAMAEDVRAALDAIGATENAANTATTAAKSLKK